MFDHTMFIQITLQLFSHEQQNLALGEGMLKQWLIPTRGKPLSLEFSITESKLLLAMSSINGVQIPGVTEPDNIWNLVQKLTGYTRFLPWLQNSLIIA